MKCVGFIKGTMEMKEENIIASTHRLDLYLLVYCWICNTEFHCS